MEKKRIIAEEQELYLSNTQLYWNIQAHFSQMYYKCLLCHNICFEKVKQNVVSFHFCLSFGSKHLKEFAGDDWLIDLLIDLMRVSFDKVEMKCENMVEFQYCTGLYCISSHKTGKLISCFVVLVPLYGKVQTTLYIFLFGWTIVKTIIIKNFKILL